MIRVFLLIVTLLSLPLSAQEGVYRFQAYKFLIDDHGGKWLQQQKATCFAISKHEVLTCAHCLDFDDREKTEGYNIELEPGKWFEAKPVLVNEDLDICVLHCEKELTPVKIGADADDGTKVTIEASYRGEPLEQHKGETTALFNTSYGRASALIQFDHGASGAPIFSDGVVIGMAVAGVPVGKKDKGDMKHDVSLYIPASQIKNFLKKMK